MQIDKCSKIVLKELEDVFETIDQSLVDSSISLIKKYTRIFVIGVGREGMMARAFAMRLMHLGKQVHWIWDDTTPNIGNSDLLIAVSGCGEIGHIDYVIRRAKEQSAKVLIVTGSRLGKSVELADTVLFIPAAVYRGKDEVVPSKQPMGNLFEQSALLLFDMMVMNIKEESDVTYEEMEKRHRNVE